MSKKRKTPTVQPPPFMPNPEGRWGHFKHRMKSLKVGVREGLRHARVRKDLGWRRFLLPICWPARRATTRPTDQVIPNMFWTAILTTTLLSLLGLGCAVHLHYHAPSREPSQSERILDWALTPTPSNGDNHADYDDGKTPLED